MTAGQLVLFDVEWCCRTCGRAFVLSVGEWPRGTCLACGGWRWDHKEVPR